MGPKAALSKRSASSPAHGPNVTAAPSATMSAGPVPLNAIVREWDQSSKGRRLKLLTDFLERHCQSTAAEIEASLGHGALLFFTRITAWVRLTYKLSPQYELAIPLAALALFLQGQRFLTNFMEIGGIQLLTDFVALPSISPPPPPANNGGQMSALPPKPRLLQDKENALLLLLHIANAGRVYREMICDGEGIQLLAIATMRETDDRLLELCGALFTALGQGNPRKTSAVHAGLLWIMKEGTEGGALAAATALRSLQLTRMAHGGGPSFGGAVKGNDDVSEGGAASSGGSLYGAATTSEELQASQSVLDAIFFILGSPNVKLRFEGMELLTIAAHHPVLLLTVLRRCFEVMETSSVGSLDDEEAVLTNSMSPNNGTAGSAGSVQALKAAAMNSGLGSTSLYSSPASAKLERQKTSCGRVICNVLQLPVVLSDSLSTERVFMLVQRHSGHITLAKFCMMCIGRDVPGMIECCKSLRLLCLGPVGAASWSQLVQARIMAHHHNSVGASYGNRNQMYEPSAEAAASTLMGSWMRGAIGTDLFREFVERPGTSSSTGGPVGLAGELSEQLAVKVSQTLKKYLLEMTAAAKEHPPPPASNPLEGTRSREPEGYAAAGDDAPADE